MFANSRILLLLCAASVLASASTVWSQETAPTPAPTATPEPDEETVVSVVESVTAPVAHPGNSQTTVAAPAIERNPAPKTFNNIIASTVPGAAALPNGAIRIRGSDNQFSYYLDGAPLPANVSAFITDQINPKNIQRLNVLTGAFPAKYGGQLSAIFDVDAKGGVAGQPQGYLQAEAGNFDTRNGAFQYSNGAGKLGYFVSGLHAESNSWLSPITAEALHNGGRENVGFAKFDYHLSPQDLLTFHLGAQDARFEVPNAPDREAVGQDDNQIENKTYFNAIWRRTQEKSGFTLSFYSHSSQNRYLGSPGDLVASPGDDDDDDGGGDDDDIRVKAIRRAQDDDDDVLISVNQRQKIRYTGVRGDFNWQRGQDHNLAAGWEFRSGRGNLDFSLTSPPDAGFDPLVDNRRFKSTDLGFYVQDDWKLGRFNLNYGARYDRNSVADNGRYSQVSPRVNLSYDAGVNTYYAFYNRLWMPVPAESIRRFEGDTPLGDLTLARIQPESDDYYGIGWKRRVGKGTFTADAYYKAIKNIIDNEDIGNTLLEVPLNEAQGIVRGIEFAYDTPLTERLNLSATYGLSRGVAAGPIIGGFLGLEDAPVSGFFADDHDQTHIANVNLTYTGNRSYALLEGQFESGLPYGELENADGDPVRINFLRAPSHFVLNAGVGRRFKHGLELALNVNNLLDKEYVVVQDNVFRRSIYGQRRSFGVKATYNF